MKVGRRDRGALHQLGTLYNLGVVGDLTDGQLLERFATDGDEAAELAFAALVERHEAMVWRVCLAVLRDRHGAEDAFQATFVVLVRKARSLWVRDSLGPWLHQTAYRTASCLRTTIARRRRHERRRAETQSAPPGEPEAALGFEHAAAVHEEVDRLPEKYRAAIVLCDLEGRTHQEAARCLGWPIGTVKSRQSHGRGLIRDRLARRGLGLLAAGAALESLNRTGLAAVTEEVSRSAVAASMRASTRLATGAGASTKVLALAREVHQSLWRGQFSSLTAAALAVGVLAGGAGLYQRGSEGPGTNGEQPAPKSAALASQPPDTDLRVRRLAVRKARAEYEMARLTRELAEIAVEEYHEVDHPRELATIEGEIQLAESDLARAKDRVAWAERMFRNRYISRSQLVSEELSFQKAKFALEQAQNKRLVSETYTKTKVVKELRTAVEAARSDEKIREAAWDRERAELIILERRLRPEESKTSY